MPRIDVPVLHRGLRPLFRVALCSQLLWPALAFADTPYDQMVRDARAGQTTPALTVLRQVPAGQATTGQISDHLQIASWAGLDAEGATAPETLRQTDRDSIRTLESRSRWARRRSKAT